MLPIFFSLKFVLPVLFILNLISIFIFRKELQYAKGPLVLFLLLICTFLFYRFLVAPAQTEKVQATRQTEINKEGWNYLNLPDLDADFQKKEIQAHYTNLYLFRLVGLQAAFAFIFSGIGLFVTSDKKLYAGFACAFLILTYLFIS